MTPSEINVAIAETMGWSWHLWGKRSIKITAPNGYKSDCWHTSDPDNSQTLPIKGGSLEASLIHYAGGFPNYHGDLNAMHEVEKTLTDKERDKYQYELSGLVSNWEGSVIKSVKMALSATASQRAISFLKTKGLWTE